MIREILGMTRLGIFPIIGLLFFLLWFIATLLWMYRKNSSIHYEQMKKLTMDDTGEIPL